MKKQTVNINFNFTLKETDIAFIGVIATLLLYVMNILGTGVFVGGDVGHIGSGIPYYGFVAPVLFITFATVMTYYSKKKSMDRVFKATYITMLLPFVAYPLALIPAGPLIVIPMFLCMPISSLSTYLYDEICDLLKTPIENLALSMNISAYKLENVVFILIIAVLLAPIIIAPIVYRFTKSTE